jgi:hypothetical protein
MSALKALPPASHALPAPLDVSDFLLSMRSRGLLEASSHCSPQTPPELYS